MTAALSIEDPAYFDRLADIEARHWWSIGMWRLTSYWLDGALAGRRGLRVLDIGCGTGMTARRLAARPEICSVVGLDPSLSALAHARNCHGFPLVRGSALALPFSAGYFDVVTCFDVWQHLPAGSDRKAAAELRRVLAPGGVAIVRSNGRGWSKAGSGYLLEELTIPLEWAGLEIERANYGNCLPALAAEARGRLCSASGSGHPSGRGLTIRIPNPAVNLLMQHVSRIEAWTTGRLGVRLPYGHSTLVLASVPG
jgi:SAM-dependent methyltransferase